MQIFVFHVPGEADRFLDQVKQMTEMYNSKPTEAKISVAFRSQGKKGEVGNLGMGHP